MDQNTWETLYRKIKFFSIANLMFFVRLYDDLIILLGYILPSSHIKWLRIKKINDSHNISHGDNVCIFVIYEREIIPKMTLDALVSIKKMGIKLFVVVNSRLNEDNELKVKQLSDISMFRNNRGKDVGAYKDCFLYLHDKGYLKNVNRLIFANDSVVYPKEHIFDLFSSLIDGETNLIGYSHVQEIHYHIQSFLFSCDNLLLNDSKFIKFWKDYIPVGRRRHMIKKGEVGITKAVIKCSKSISTINDLSILLSHAQQHFNLIDITEILLSLPTKDIPKIQLNALNDLVNNATNALTDRIKNLRVEVTPELLKSILTDVDINNTYVNKVFVFNLLLFLVPKNNTHWNTFIFLKCGMKVVIKRDSSIRGGYDHDIFKGLLLKYFDSEEALRIMAMIKSPSASHLKGISRIMFEHGVI